MIFRNAINLLIDNFKLNFKYLLYLVIVSVVSAGLSAAIILPNVAFIFSSAELQAILELFKDFFAALTKGDTEFLSGFSELLKTATSDFVIMFKSQTTNIVLTVISVVFITLISRFLGGIGNFTTGCVLNDRLSCYADISFTSAYIKNLGKSSFWLLFYVPLTFVYDILVIALCYLVFIVLLKIVNVGILAVLFSFAISVTLYICSQAVKLTFANGMKPAIVADKEKLGKAIKKGFKSGWQNFGRLFATYVVTCYIILALNVVAVLFTFGSALLLTIPASYILMVCIEFISYYNIEKKKYFATADKIVVPHEQQPDENFYDNININ